MGKIGNIFGIGRKATAPATSGGSQQLGPEGTRILKLFNSGKYAPMLRDLPKVGFLSREGLLKTIMESPSLNLEELIGVGIHSSEEVIKLGAIEVLLKVGSDKAAEGMIEIIRQAKVDEYRVDFQKVLSLLGSADDAAMSACCRALISKGPAADKYEVVAEEISKILLHIAGKIKDTETQKTLISAPRFLRNKIQWSPIFTALAKNPLLSPSLHRDLFDIISDGSGEQNAVPAFLARGDIDPAMYQYMQGKTQDSRFKSLITLKEEFGVKVTGHIFADAFCMSSLVSMLSRMPRHLMDKIPLKEITIGSFDLQTAMDPNIGGTYDQERSEITIKEHLIASEFIHTFWHEFGHHISLNIFGRKGWQALINIFGWQLIRGDFTLSAIDIGGKDKMELMRSAWVSEGPNNELFCYVGASMKDFNDAQVYASKSGRKVNPVFNYRYKTVFEMAAEDLIGYFDDTASFELQARQYLETTGSDAILKELALFKAMMTFNIDGQWTRFEFGPTGHIAIPVEPPAE
jgi:hypothetical protein